MSLHDIFEGFFCSSILLPRRLIDYPLSKLSDEIQCRVVPTYSWSSKWTSSTFALSQPQMSTRPKYSGRLLIGALMPTSILVKSLSWFMPILRAGGSGAAAVPSGLFHHCLKVFLRLIQRRFSNLTGFSFYTPGVSPGDYPATHRKESFSHQYRWTRAQQSHR